MDVGRQRRPTGNAGENEDDNGQPLKSRDGSLSGEVSVSNYRKCKLRKSRREEVGKVLPAINRCGIPCKLRTAWLTMCTNRIDEGKEGQMMAKPSISGCN